MHVVAGRPGDTPGAMESLTDTSMFTVELKDGARLSLPAPADRTVFLYVADGSIAVGGHKIDRYTRVEFDRSGDEVGITAGSDVRPIYGHAPLIEEPVAALGPFVMTSQAEVQQAACKYQSGLFD